LRDIEKLVRQKIQVAAGSKGTVRTERNGTAATGRNGTARTERTATTSGAEAAAGTEGSAHHHNRAGGAGNSHARTATGQHSQGPGKTFAPARKKRHNHRHFGKKRLASSWR
jgi:hypothetical protein